MTDVHRLLRFKLIERLSTYVLIKCDCFLLFSILDHICTTCLFLQKLLEKFFQILQIAKGIRK
jgi:hypothetical protein